ncbi:MAG: hypothetical protein HDQ91_06225 [Desulfovibrio sp.]|nr:hypothetical protein [Desulfovibrio sp.]
MDSEMIREFSTWRAQGLLTEAEFAQVSRQLLGSGQPVPDWIGKLRNACSLAAAGQIGSADLDAIKADLFSSRQNSAKETPVDADAESLVVLRVCAGIACVIGLFPLPVAHAPLLIITQYVMLRKICAKFGRRPGLYLILIILAAVLGPLVFGLLLRFLPFARAIFGAIIAGGLTWYIGAKTRAMCIAGLDFTFRNFIHCRVKPD